MIGALIGRLAVMLALLPGVALADVVDATGAKLRLLDKMSGIVSDYDVARGQSQVEGRLTVRLDDCRYPSDLPSAEAYAHLTITNKAGTDTAATTPVFSGWMIASSPGLSALDHPRYDVWVLNCDVPAAAPAATATGNGSGG